MRVLLSMSKQNKGIVARLRAWLSKSKQNEAMVANFAPADRAAAATLISGLIETYGGRDIERVLRVVLAMADGDLASLADAVRLAQGDYRDVLVLEKFTGAGKLRSEPAREWLEKYFAEDGMAVPKGLR
jgi:hypothetical protein